MIDYIWDAFEFLSHTKDFQAKIFSIMKRIGDFHLMKKWVMIVIFSALTNGSL